jgi:hypothetical protein
VRKTLRLDPLDIDARELAQRLGTGDRRLRQRRGLALAKQLGTP